MKWGVGLLCALILLVAVMIGLLIRSQNQAADQPDYFEEEILVFENADSVSFPEPGQIVFVVVQACVFGARL